MAQKTGKQSFRMASSGSKKSKGRIESNAKAKQELDAQLVRKNKTQDNPFPVEKYRDPPEVEDEKTVDLDALDEPPADFKCPFVSNREPQCVAGVALIKFHFWGINHHFPHEATERAAAFRKLFYNQDPRYRVKSKSDMENINLDAGPRLLKPEILKRLNKAPISRHYPDIPETEEAWEQQRLAPRKPSLVDGNSPVPDPGDGDEEEPACPETVPPNLNIVKKTLERLLIRLRYKDLEVPPSMNEGQQTQGGYISTLDGWHDYGQPTKIGLSFDLNHEFELQENGIGFTRLGGGPTLRPGFPAVILAGACIIVVGKFLSAGLTNIDLSEFALGEAEENSIHQLFVSLVKTDWNLGSLHEELMRPYLRQIFQSNHSWNFYYLLAKSTLLRKQFYISQSTVARCENDHESPINQSWLAVLTVKMRLQSRNMTIEELLQQALQPQSSGSTTESQRICSAEDCGKHLNKLRWHYTMPLRLAFCPPHGMFPANHTSDNIQIKIFNEKGEEETVVYRWLGGIYLNTKRPHYRVYWTEFVLGERKTNTVRMYDPLVLNGSIIGDIKPSQDGSFIPNNWWPIVLFYERVLNPDPLDITLTTAVLGDIGYATHQGNFIIQHNGPSGSEPSAPVSRNGDEGWAHMEYGSTGASQVSDQPAHRKLENGPNAPVAQADNSAVLSGGTESSVHQTSNAMFGNLEHMVYNSGTPTGNFSGPTAGVHNFQDQTRDQRSGNPGPMPGWSPPQMNDLSAIFHDFDDYFPIASGADGLANVGQSIQGSFDFNFESFLSNDDLLNTSGVQNTSGSQNNNGLQNNYDPQHNLGNTGSTEQTSNTASSACFFQPPLQDYYQQTKGIGQSQSPTYAEQSNIYTQSPPVNNLGTVVASDTNGYDMEALSDNAQPSTAPVVAQTPDPSLLFQTYTSTMTRRVNNPPQSVLKSRHMSPGVSETTRQQAAAPSDIPPSNMETYPILDHNPQGEIRPNDLCLNSVYLLPQQPNVQQNQLPGPNQNGGDIWTGVRSPDLDEFEFFSLMPTSRKRVPNSQRNEQENALHGENKRARRDHSPSH